MASEDSFLNYDDNDRAHARCIAKLKRVDSQLNLVGEVYLPNLPEDHDPRQMAAVEHLLESIQDAERDASNIEDEKLKTEMLEEVYLRRIIFYDILDVVRLDLD